MDLVGIERFVSDLPIIAGTIKGTPTDFKVTEHLLPTVFEPPTKRIRTIEHEELDPKLKTEILSKIVAFGAETAEMIQNGKTIAENEISLGMVKIEHRKYVHSMVIENCPWLQTRTAKGKL